MSYIVLQCFTQFYIFIYFLFLFYGFLFSLNIFYFFIHYKIKVGGIYSIENMGVFDFIRNYIFDCQSHQYKLILSSLF